MYEETHPRVIGAWNATPMSLWLSLHRSCRDSLSPPVMNTRRPKRIGGDSVPSVPRVEMAPEVTLRNGSRFSRRAAEGIRKKKKDSKGGCLLSSGVPLSKNAQFEKSSKFPKFRIKNRKNQSRLKWSKNAIFSVWDSLYLKLKIFDFFSVVDL